MTPSTINRRASVSGFGIKSSVSVLALATSLAVSTPTFAQDKSFDIDPGPAAATLNQLAEQADVSVVYSFDVVDGITTNEVEGSFEVFEALEMLVEGTGLTVVNGTGGAYAVRFAEFEGQDTTAPVQTAQLDPEVEVPVVKIEPVAVTGTVIAEGSEANLKGAQVEIVETGQTTATDDLGRFRFPSVVPGDYTLRITYLGRNPIVAMVAVGAQGFRQTFPMSSEWGGDEVVVYGSWSARAQSLNLERTAENFSTVLSSDLLGEFSGTTLSESLRRAPGVTFETDRNTGDGANVILRGLEPDLNQIQLNGLRLPESSGTGRSAGLNTLLTDSIDKVVISKTLLPNQDSSGTGGLIEIETKSPLDRAKRFARFGIEGSRNGDDFGSDVVASGILSGIFGDGDIGASLSVQYRDRDVTQIGYDAGLRMGQYLPEGISSPAQIDPSSPFPFEDGVDLAIPTFTSTGTQSVDTENLTITASLQKAFSDHTDWRFDYSRIDESAKRFQRTRVTTVIPRTLELPIAELGGDLRFVTFEEDAFAPVFPGFIVRSAIGTTLLDSETITDVFSFRGETRHKNFEFNYSAGYTAGKSDTPIDLNSTLGLGTFANITQLDRSDLTADATNLQIDGRVLSIFPAVSPNEDPGFLFPAINDSGIGFFNDIENFNEFGITEGGFSGENTRFSLNGSARRSFSNDHLQYVEFGFDYEDAEFRSQASDTRLTIRSLAPSLSDLGLRFDDGDLARVGASSSGFSSISQSSYEAFLQNLDQLAGRATPLVTISETQQRPELSEAFTEEREFAPYLQARLDFDKLEVIGGVRMSHVELKTAFFSTPRLVDANGVLDTSFSDQFAEIVTEETSLTDILPRVLANYRQSEDMIWRAGYFTSIARPTIRQLSSSQFVTLRLDETGGPNGDQPSLFVSQGNAQLKPARTHNFDLSWEWYHDQVGVAKVSGFYKRIDNFLDSTRTIGGIELLPSDLELPNAPEFNNLPANLFVQVSQPLNNEDTAEIWGMEFAIERRFTFLPAPWSGLGGYANYTYSDSSRSTVLTSLTLPQGTKIDDVPFSGQAKHSGTVALTYNYNNIDANLIYSIQDRRLVGFAGNNLSSYVEPIDTLDFRVEYRLPNVLSDLRLFLEGNDLLKGASDPFVQKSIGGVAGTPKYYNGGEYYGGRTIALGLAATF